jgi:hypothetical protein
LEYNNTLNVSRALSGAPVGLFLRGAGVRCVTATALFLLFIIPDISSYFSNNGPFSSTVSPCRSILSPSTMHSSIVRFAKSIPGYRRLLFLHCLLGFALRSSIGRMLGKDALQPVEHMLPDLPRLYPPLRPDGKAQKYGGAFRTGGVHSRGSDREAGAALTAKPLPP